MSRTRNILILLLTFILLPGVTTAQDTAEVRDTIRALKHPESVADNADGTAFYASNIGDKLAPSEKDGDGFITRLSPDGTVDFLRYLPATKSDVTLHAPKGTVVADGRVFTADIDRVLGFDAESRELVVEIGIEGASFLNDVTAMDAQTLFVSDSEEGRIHRIDVAEERSTALDVNIPGVNGLTYVPDDRTLYAVTFGGEQAGQLWTLQLTEEGAVRDTSSQTLLEGGRFDSVVQRPDGTLLISDWGVEDDEEAPPALHSVDPASGTMTTRELSGWQGPADFTCSDKGGGCWIPDLPASVVRIVAPEN